MKKLLRILITLTRLVRPFSNQRSSVKICYVHFHKWAFIQCWKNNVIFSWWFQALQIDGRKGSEMWNCIAYTLTGGKVGIMFCKKLTLGIFQKVHISIGMYACNRLWIVSITITNKNFTANFYFSPLQKSTFLQFYICQMPQLSGNR